MNPEESGASPNPYDLDHLDDLALGSYDVGQIGYADNLYEKLPDACGDGRLGYHASTGGEYGQAVQFNVPSNGFTGRLGSGYRWDMTGFESEYDFSGPRAALAHTDDSYGIDTEVNLLVNPNHVVLASLPPISTTFRFAIDRRPRGREQEYIPARVYTTYFANRQIPIAAPGHLLHEHDKSHSKTYAKAFSIPEFADMVQVAANNALTLPDDDGAKVFTRAMDRFGDALTFDDVFNHGSSTYAGLAIKSARANLQALVGLYFKHSGEEVPPLGEIESEVFDMLWYKLGFQAREARGPQSLSMLHRLVMLEESPLQPSKQYIGPYNDYTFLTHEGSSDRLVDYTYLNAPTKTGRDFATTPHPAKNGSRLSEGYHLHTHVSVDQLTNEIAENSKNQD